jgi:transcriptional regulator with XRE-family HTH domain
MAVIHDKETGKYYGVAAEAKRIGVSITFLSDFLHGRRSSPKLKKLVRIKHTVNG